jgi:hypothetical protein
MINSFDLDDTLIRGIKSLKPKSSPSSTDSLDLRKLGLGRLNCLKICETKAIEFIFTQLRFGRKLK